MKTLRFLISVLLLCFFANFTASAAEIGSFSILDFYAYDKNLPLNATVSPQTVTNGDYLLYRVEFDSVWGRRVPALFMIPSKHEKQCPAVIFGHGYTGSKNDIVSSLPKISEKGFCAFAIDAWYHGDRKVEGKKLYSPFLYEMRSGLTLTVVDFRRAVDFLTTRSEVDHDKITFVGGSMGGILGGLFAGVDNRVKCPVLIVGGGNWPYLLENSVVGQVDLGFTYSDTKRIAKQAVVALAPADTLNTIQYISPRPLLMINAKHDVLVNPFSNKQMFTRAGEPKKIIWFDSGHGVPIDIAMNIMLDWYDKYLINGRTPDFTASIEGYETTPVGISKNIKLPPLVTEQSYNEFLNYNHELPLLSSRDSLPSSNPRVSKFKIGFQSTLDRFVDGILYLPTKGSPPYPCVVFVHDFGGSSEDATFIADILARNGIATVSVGLYSFLSDNSNPFLTNASFERNNITGIQNSSPVNTTPATSNSRTFQIYPSYEYEFRDLIKQTVQDIQRTVDMLYKFDGILAQSLTIVGVGMGANAGLITAATDDRISGVYMIDPYDSIIPYSQNDSSKATQSDIAEYRNNIKVIQPIEYVQNLSPKKLAIFRRTNSNKPSDLYEQAKEPKELISSAPSKDGVSNWIGTALRSIAVFVRDIITKSPEDAQKNDKQSGLATIQAPSGQIDGWNRQDSGKNDSKKCKVTDLSFAEKAIEGGRTIILNSRIDACATKNASIIAEISGTAPSSEYIQLFDDGDGCDNKAGDGIFCAVFDLSKDTANIDVTVGGVGDSGEIIIEKTASIK